MAKASKEIWDIDGLQIPVYIYRERRYNNRISITKKGVNLRVPKMGASLLKESHRSWAIDWLRSQLDKRPDIVARFTPHKYNNGYEIMTPFRKYVLNLQKSNRATSSGKLIGDIIKINLSDRLSDPDMAKTIRTLASRTIGKDQLARVSSRIHEINDQCFAQEIKKVRIKNNSSNWGSCSHTGNINISTKTLLAPFEIQDYIFVHELAHRIEMNHSPKYWSIVGKVMPGYLKYERWIKKNGHLCEI